MFRTMGRRWPSARGASRWPHLRPAPMRKASIALAMLALALGSLALAGAAAAVPVVTLKVKAVPIPGFPGTGDHLGAGATVEVEVTISGTEYGGYPSPLTGLNLYSPNGSKLTTAGFVTCADSVLEADGGAGCPKKSRAGPLGVGLGVVAFGGHPVPEKVT